MSMLDRIMNRTGRAADHAGRQVRDARNSIGTRPAGPGWIGSLVMAAVAAAGAAAAAWLLDPARGSGRRARLLDQGAATVRRAGRQAERAVRNVQSTAAGKLAAVRNDGSGQEDPDDATLAAKVQTALFRKPDVPKGDINVNVEHGVVVLRGEVPSATLSRRLAKEAERVEGVQGVHNLLHLPGEPAPDEATRAATAS